MYVEILAKSVNPHTGIEITTLHLVYPQNIHAQVLTHRVFSRNASSMRAISFKRSLDFELVYPLWTKEKRGMVGERFDVSQEKERETVNKADALVKEMFESTKGYLKQLHDLGIHHQDINDYLRPFQNIHVVLTSTEWKNFFDLRLEDDAKPVIQLLAREMFIQLKKRKANKTVHHLPLVTEEEKEILTLEECFLLSGRRCARISYLTKHKEPEEDIVDAKRMIKNKHLSPFEHAAVAINSIDKFANFTSWQSYRFMKGY